MLEAQQQQKKHRLSLLLRIKMLTSCVEQYRSIQLIMTPLLSKSAPTQITS